MTAALARRLVWEGVTAPAEATAALRAHVRERVAFLSALVRARPSLEGAIELELGLARSSLSDPIVVNRELWDALPPGLCETLLAVPIGRDAVTGAVRVVAAHHGEGHVENEIAFHLQVDVIVEIGPLGTVLAAIEGLRERSNVRASLRTPPPHLRVTQSFGSPLAGGPKADVAPAPLQRPASIVPARPASIAPGPEPAVAGKVRSIPTIAIASSSPSSIPPSGEPVISLTRTKSLRPLATGPTVVFDSPELRGPSVSPPAPSRMESRSTAPLATPSPPVARATPHVTPLPPVAPVAPVARSTAPSGTAPPPAPVGAAGRTEGRAKRAQSVFSVTLHDGTAPAAASAIQAAASGSPAPRAASAPELSPEAGPEPLAPAKAPPVAEAKSEDAVPSRREIIDAAALDAALDELASATTPERVVTILVYAMENVARRVVVFAARSKAYEGRETNHGPTRNAVRELSLRVEADTVLKAAVRTGRFVGPLPPGVANDGLRRVLGDPMGEVVVGVVTVRSRPALVYVATGFDSVRLATRRGEQLALAASQALERILRDRKK